MKNLLVLFSVLFLSVQSSYAQYKLTATLSGNTEYETPLIGLNSVHTGQKHNDTNAQSVTNSTGPTAFHGISSYRNVLKKLGPRSFRYPGGLEANFWDWHDGKFKNKFEYPDYPVPVTECDSSNGIKFCTGGSKNDTEFPPFKVDEFKDLMDDVTTIEKPVFVANVTFPGYEKNGVSYNTFQDQIDIINSSFSSGTEINLELGNELWIGDLYNNTAFPSGNDYVSDAKQLLSNAVNVSNYKFSLVMPVDGTTGSDTRKQAWDDEVINYLINNSAQPGVDKMTAFSFHLYQRGFNKLRYYDTQCGKTWVAQLKEGGFRTSVKDGSGCSSSTRKHDRDEILRSVFAQAKNYPADRGASVIDPLNANTSLVNMEKWITEFGLWSQDQNKNNTIPDYVNEDVDLPDNSVVSARVEKVCDIMGTWAAGLFNVYYGMELLKWQNVKFLLAHVDEGRHIGYMNYGHFIRYKDDNNDFHYLDLTPRGYAMKNLIEASKNSVKIKPIDFGLQAGRDTYTVEYGASSIATYNDNPYVVGWSFIDDAGTTVSSIVLNLSPTEYYIDGSTNALPEFFKSEQISSSDITSYNIDPLRKIGNSIGASIIKNKGLTEQEIFDTFFKANKNLIIDHSVGVATRAIHLPPYSLTRMTKPLDCQTSFQIQNVNDIVSSDQVLTQNLITREDLEIVGTPNDLLIDKPINIVSGKSISFKSDVRIMGDKGLSAYIQQSILSECPAISSQTRSLGAGDNTSSFIDLDNKKITIFPNPTDDKVEILPIENETISRIIILDASGKIINDINVFVDGKINIPGSGLFYLKIFTDKNLYISKVLKY